MYDSVDWKVLNTNAALYFNVTRCHDVLCFYLSFLDRRDKDKNSGLKGNEHFQKLINFIFSAE
jgi:hypothetical protein